MTDFCYYIIIRPRNYLSVRYSVILLVFFAKVNVPLMLANILWLQRLVEIMNLTVDNGTSSNITVEKEDQKLTGEQWPFIIRWSTTIVMAVCSIAGNGLTLVVIGTTPSLQTKTNKMLASLAAAEIVVSVNAMLVFIYYLEAYLIGRPCHHVVLDTVTTTPVSFTTYN